VATYLEIDVVDSYGVIPHTSAAPADVIVLAEPGAQGPAGELDPAQLAGVVEDATENVLDELVPDINLVVLFRNIRSQG
jgi:hypothetical protein